MTLGGATTDYVNSVGTSVYNYTGGYSKDVVGIAKDTTNTFDQRISKSVNSGSLLTLSTDTNFTNANTTHANTLTDGQYLVVANDGAALTEQTSELDLASYSSRIGREWRARNTGSVGAINLQFSGYDDNYILLQDADGDFSTGATNAGYLSATGAINTTLADGQYITLAETATPSSLSFSISDDAIGFGNLSSSLTKYATGDGFGSTTSAIAHAISASTNAVNGYVIELEGTEFICQSCSNSYTISSVGATPVAPIVGSEQFGMNIVPTGTGTVSSPYNTANYAYSTTGMPSIVANGVGDDTVTNFALEYMANTQTLTPAGHYQVVLTYTMHALF